MKRELLKKLTKELLDITTYAELNHYEIVIHLESLKYLKNGVSKLLEIIQWVQETNLFQDSLSWEVAYFYYDDIEEINILIPWKK